MIKIINRSMSIPIPDRVIGHVGDNLVETRSFELNRYYGEVDLSEFSFKLDTEIDGNKNIIDLDKTVEDDKITLTWTVHASHVLHAGRMTIQLRAFHDDIEKWHSAQDYVIIQDSIKAPDDYSSLLPSEFEQMELRVTTLKEQAEASAQTATEQANRAQGIADEFENETLPAAIAAVEAAVDEQVDIAASHADRAQGIADTFENTTLPAAIQSVEQAVEEQIGIAKGHADRAQELADTFEQTTLPAAITAVEAAGQAKVDLAEQQADRVEDIIQEAEQDVLPELRQAIEDGRGTKGQLEGSIQEAGEAKTALDGSISAAGPTKTGLDGSISSAGVAKTQLDGSISSANGIKSQLDGSITAAGQAKELLDESIATGDLVAFRYDFESHLNDYATYKDSNNLKIVKVEKELNDYKATIQQINVNQEATQSVSGYGIISLPPNAANGQVSDVRVLGRTVVNLLGDDGNCEGIDGQDIPINKLNNTTASYKKFSNERCVFGNTSIKIICNDSAGIVKQDYANVVSGKYWFLSLYRWYENVSQNAFTGILYNYQSSTGGSPGSSTISGSSNGWERYGRKFQGMGEDGTSIIWGGRASSWSGTIYIDGCMLLEITEDEYNNLSVEQLLEKYPYVNGTKSTNSVRIRSVNEDETKESIAYVNLPQGEELRSLPNDVKDEVSLSEGKLIKRVSDKIQLKDLNWVRQSDGDSTNFWGLRLSLESSLLNSLTVRDSFVFINYNATIIITTYNTWAGTDDLSIWYGTIRPCIKIPKTEIVGTIDNAKAKAWFEQNRVALIYQLAQPIEIPIQTSGSLVSYPSGTVYIEPFVADAGIYTDKMSVLHQDLPIKVLEKLSKIDFMTGLETELDVSDAVIAEDKLSFTHPDLVEGDIVFFVYEHDRESTEGETEIEYYDSRYVIKGEDDKFYQWEIEAKLVEGVITPSIKLVEV